MDNGEKRQPSSVGRGQAAKQERAERSARALRDNLRRRKMQVRERAEDCNGGRNITNDSPDDSPDNFPDPEDDPNCSDA